MLKVGHGWSIAFCNRTFPSFVRCSQSLGRRTVCEATTTLAISNSGGGIETFLRHESCAAR
jgi:hypothetical protein